MKLNKELIIIKKNKLTDFQQKLFLLLIDKIYNEGNKKIYTLNINDILNNIKTSYNRINKIKKILLDFQNIILIFKEKTPNDTKYINVTIFPVIKHYKYSKEIEFELHDFIKQKIFSKSSYVYLDLKTIINLKSKYSILIYLLAKQFIDLKRGKIYELNEF